MTGALQQILFLAIGTVLLLGPGIGVIQMIPALRRRSSLDETLLLGLLLSCGIGAAWLALGRAAGLRLPAWSGIYLAVSLALAGLGALVRLRERAAPRPLPGERNAHPPSRSVLALAGAVFVLMLFTGGALGPVHDSLDFVSFVQESLETGELSPQSVLYRVPPETPPDPRRGSFHAQVAAICRISGTSPADAWRWLPRILAPLAVFAMGAMLRAWIGRGAALLATFLFFAYTLFSRDHFLQNIAYASRFGWVVGWAGLLAFARGLDLLRSGDGDGLRDARWHLALAAASPILLLPVHMLSGIQTLLAVGCAGIAVLLLRESDRRSRLAVLAVGGIAAVILAPALALRVGGTGGVENPIFDHVYGVLYVAKGWPILHPTYLLERFGVAGLCATVLGLGLAGVARRGRAAGFLFWSTLIPVVILFFPPLVRTIVAAHAHSLLFRVILTIPVAGILSWCSLAALRRIQAREGTRRTAPAIATLVVVAGAVIGQVADTRSEWAVPEKRRAGYRENESLLDALQFLERQDPGRRLTVLSDPVSSYAIPAYTRHDAVSPLHQHSSPTDPTVVERIQDVQEALSPRVGLARTFEVLRRYSADVILLNQSWKRYVSAYYVFISPLGYEETRGKFDARPDLFEPIYDSGGVRIYRVHDPGPDAQLPGDPPNPARVEDPRTPPILAGGAVDLVRMEPRPGPHHPGGDLGFDVVWRRTEKPYRLPTICDVKLQDLTTPDRFDVPVLGRIARAAAERREHRIFRVGWSYRPLAWIYPDFLWMPGETYKDEIWIGIPIACRPGVYEVRIRLGTEPYAAVGSLEEYVSNRLGDDWILLTTIRIEPAESRPASS